MVANLISKTLVNKFKVITEEAFNKVTSLFADLKREMDK